MARVAGPIDAVISAIAAGLANLAANHPEAMQSVATMLQPLMELDLEAAKPCVTALQSNNDVRGHLKMKKRRRRRSHSSPPPARPQRHKTCARGAAGDNIAPWDLPTYADYPFSNKCCCCFRSCNYHRQRHDDGAHTCRISSEPAKANIQLIKLGYDGKCQRNNIIADIKAGKGYRYAGIHHFEVDYTIKNGVYELHDETKDKETLRGVRGIRKGYDRGKMPLPARPFGHVGINDGIVTSVRHQDNAAYTSPAPKASEPARLLLLLGSAAVAAAVAVRFDSFLSRHTRARVRVR